MSASQELSDQELRQKLNLETAQIAWHELQRSFAQGRLLLIDPSLDLVEVGLQFIRDNQQQCEQWLSESLVQLVQEQQAQQWFEQDRVFWGLVIVPWVLIQDTKQ